MQFLFLRIEFQSTACSVARFSYFLAALAGFFHFPFFFVLPFPVTLPGVIKKFFSTFACHVRLQEQMRYIVDHPIVK